MNRINLKKESSVFKGLNHFTTVSDGVLDSFRSLYPSIEDHSTLLYNGFDTTDFTGLEKKKNAQFTIRYVGTLAISQNPKILFEALAKLKQENAALASKLKVEFWGKFDKVIKDTVEKYCVTDIVDFFGYVNHSKAVELMQESDMLVLVIPEGNSKGILTGKLFEYIATGNRVLGFGPEACEAQLLVQENGFGFFAHKAEVLIKSIAESVEKWEEGESFYSSTEKDQFSRKSLTKKLSEIFNKTIEECS